MFNSVNLHQRRKKWLKEVQIYRLLQAKILFLGFINRVMWRKECNNLLLSKLQNWWYKGGGRLAPPGRLARLTLYQMILQYMSLVIHKILTIMLLDMTLISTIEYPCWPRLSPPIMVDIRSYPITQQSTSDWYHIISLMKISLSFILEIHWFHCYSPYTILWKTPFCISPYLFWNTSSKMWYHAFVF